jgi:hypothetical protein
MEAGGNMGGQGVRSWEDKGSGLGRTRGQVLHCHTTIMFTHEFDKDTCEAIDLGNDQPDTASYVRSADGVLCGTGRGSGLE